jgi:hypothetical protein
MSERFEDVCEICRAHANNPDEHAHGWMRFALEQHHAVDRIGRKLFQYAVGWALVFGGVVGFLLGIVLAQ